MYKLYVIVKTYFSYFSEKLIISNIHIFMYIILSYYFITIGYIIYITLCYHIILNIFIYILSFLLQYITCTLY